MLLSGGINLFAFAQYAFQLYDSLGLFGDFPRRLIVQNIFKQLYEIILGVQTDKPYPVNPDTPVSAARFIISYFLVTLHNSFLLPPLNFFQTVQSLFPVFHFRLRLCL